MAERRRPPGDDRSLPGGGRRAGEPATAAPILTVRALGVRARREGTTILRGVALDVARGQVTGIIGPSGAGKSTLLRCLNRLVDLTPNLAVTGTVTFDGADVRRPGTDPDALRQRIGMVFQQPVVFPGSVRKNVLFGARRLGLVARGGAEELIARVLTQAGLWEEVRDRLAQPAATLSVGQQQRLALARALATGPEVLLMDEPTSALDARSTAAIEATIAALGGTTVVLVTHDLAQARRLADWVACICPRDGAGELVEADCCETIFSTPACRETMEYLGLARAG